MLRTLNRGFTLISFIHSSHFALYGPIRYCGQKKILSKSIKFQSIINFKCLRFHYVFRPPARPDLDVSIDLIFSISHQLDRGTPLLVLHHRTKIPKWQKAFSEICLACRTGDIEVVDSLLFTPNLDINQVDEYDYSPLILSSLCEHYDIVELLLQRGAVCDRDTFQEHVVYMVL